MEKEKKGIGLEEIAGMVAGLLLIFSGITKSLDAALFARTINAYGFGEWQFMSPVIIAAEVIIGACLVFGIRTKQTAATCGIMIAIFTAVYTYALLTKGITDCGCFGGIKALNSSPAFLYIKNVLLMGAMVFLYIKGESERARYEWMYAMIILAVGVAAFKAGRTYRYEKNYKGEDAVAVADSPLKDFISTSKDSTYAVFVFSYSCPHCMNSIANLNEYEKRGAVDRVIGIALKDSVGEAFFREKTEPKFEICAFSSGIFDITNSFPLTFYIKDDSIRMQIRGEMPSAYVFKQMSE